MGGPCDLSELLREQPTPAPPRRRNARPGLAQPPADSREPGPGGQTQLAAAIARLPEEETLKAFRVGGRRCDCGSKLGFLEATVAFALKHPEIGKQFQAMLAKRRD